MGNLSKNGWSLEDNTYRKTMIEKYYSREYKGITLM